MAELLIRTQNNAHVDPRKDRATYKRGDVVVVMPDGHVWGRLESKQQWVSEGLPENAWPGGFVVVKVPGPVSDYADLVAEQNTPDSNRYRRRNKNVNLTALRSKLDADAGAKFDSGVAVVDATALRAEEATKPTVSITTALLNLRE